MSLQVSRPYLTCWAGNISATANTVMTFLQCWHDMRKLTDSWQLVEACCETSSMLQESICAPPSSRKMGPILHLSNLRAKRYVIRDKRGSCKWRCELIRWPLWCLLFFLNYHAEMKPRQIWKTSVISICYRGKEKGYQSHSRKRRDGLFLFIRRLQPISIWNPQAFSLFADGINMMTGYIICGCYLDRGKWEYIVSGGEEWKHTGLKNKGSGDLNPVVHLFQKQGPVY